jgi:hypothetical protein
VLLSAGYVAATAQQTKRRVKVTEINRDALARVKTYTWTASHPSFDTAADRLQELCLLKVSNDTIRRVSEEEGQAAKQFLSTSDVPAKAFAKGKGDVEFFVLDSNYMSPQQLTWIEDKLKNSGAKWKIAYFHHPMFTSAKFHGPDLDLRQQLMPLFLKYGVNAVWSGHEHVYERIKPQKGIYYFVSGSAGQLRKGNVRPAEETAAYFDQDQSFMLVEVAADDMFFQVISRTGKTVDSGVIHRQAKG